MTARLTPERAITAVREYRKKGWRVFPLPVGEKKPDREKGWLKQVEGVTDDNVEELWGRGENVGVVLDPPIVDVDLDCDEAVRVADRFLPPTPCRFTRKSVPGIAHWVYECPGEDNPSKAFTDPVQAARRRSGRDVGKGTLLEVRHKNGYTMFPPSVHPSGEQLTWARGGGWPEAVLFHDLYRRCHVIAACALMIRYWPGPGSRNEATLALCGGLVGAERQTGGSGDDKKPLIDPRVNDIIVRALVEEGGNTDPVSDFNALERTRKTYDKRDSGGDVRIKGWQTLAKILGADGKDIVRQFREWLDILPRSAKNRSSIPLMSAPFSSKIVLEDGGGGSMVPVKGPDNVAVVLAWDESVTHDDEGDGSGGEGPGDDGDDDPVRLPYVYYDEFQRCKMVSDPMPWDHFKNYTHEFPRRWTDHDVLELQSYLVRTWGLVVGKEVAADGVELHAMRHRRHEVRDYLKELMWDKVSRLEDMGTLYFSCQRSEYVRKAFRLWMISAVARIMVPGVQCDNVLILEGEQGIGKSSALRTLAVSDDWFTDAPINMHDKSGAEVLQGSWIIELAELTSMRRAEVNTVKEYISRRTDKFRPAFGRETVSLPRQCVFAGSVNPGFDGYLKDHTGERRFWPVPCGKKIDFTALKEDRDQLWAEAYFLYTIGERWFFTEKDSELQKEFSRVQRSRQEKDEHEDVLVGWIEKKMRELRVPELRFTVHQALHEAFGYSIKEMSERYRKSAIGRTCQRLGFERIGQAKFTRVWSDRDGVETTEEVRSVAYRVTQEMLYAVVEEEVELTRAVDPSRERTGADDDIPF